MNLRGLPAIGSHRPPLDPRALARQILSEPRFRMRVQSPARKTWWDTVLAWLHDRWAQLIDAFARHVHVSAKTSVAAGDIILVAVAAVVVIAIVRLLANAVRAAAAPAAVASLDSPAANADALHAQSVRAAERGDYPDAIALLFRAALAVLNVRGVLHDEPSRTVNECRRAVYERAPGSLSSFEALARTFTAAVYAEAPASNAQWDAAYRAYAQLAGGVARGA